MLVLVGRRYDEGVTCSIIKSRVPLFLFCHVSYYSLSSTTDSTQTRGQPRPPYPPE